MTRSSKWFNKYRTRLIFLVLLASISPNSHAYLDPGTGGMLIQAFLAILVGVALFFSTLKMKISNFFSSLDRNNKDKQEPEDD